MTTQTYRVRAGDTLSRIARTVRTTVARLVAVNRLADPDRILAGQVLRVPSRPALPPPLGQLSRKYEVGTRGPGAVSSGRGDFGGVSYGSYQLSAKFGRVTEFLASEGKPWRARFSGHESGSEAFSEIWRQCAAEDAPRFEAAQHAFIERTHYLAQVSLLETKAVFDVRTRSRALQEVVGSTAVQHGPGCGIVLHALRQVAPPPTDRALIAAIYAERARRRDSGALAYFGGSSRAVQEGVARRLASECRDALAMLKVAG